MALDIAGSSTTKKKRTKNRVRCTDCKNTIRLKAELVRGDDGLPYHLLCAGFVHHEKLTPCPTCFIIAPCLCVGS